MTICVALFRGKRKKIKYFASPNAEKILISHKGRIHILHLPMMSDVEKISISQKGRYIFIISCQMAPYIIVNSQKGENIYANVHHIFHLSMGRKYFQAKRSKRARISSFPRIEGFSHWVFPIWRFWHTHIVMHVMLFHCNYARWLEGECWEVIHAHSQHIYGSHDT